jgi:hypothetical protein
MVAVFPHPSSFFCDLLAATFALTRFMGSNFKFQRLPRLPLDEEEEPEASDTSSSHLNKIPSEVKVYNSSAFV